MKHLHFFSNHATFLDVYLSISYCTYTKAYNAHDYVISTELCVVIVFTFIY